MQRSMKSMRRLMNILAATLFVVGPFFADSALAVPVLPEGTLINGNPTSLLGFDASLIDYVAGGVSAVDDQNIEFLTDDFALAIDFQSDGLLRLFDNVGTGDDLFNDTLRFSFTGLGATLANIQLVDANAITGGSLLFHIVDGRTFDLTLRDVKFAPGFSHVDLALSVDEPSILALFALGIMIGFVALRRQAHFIRCTGVAP